MRNVLINGKTYKYRVGKGHTVILIDDTKHVVANHELCGLYPDQFEHGQIKKTIDGMITPRRIKLWIAKTTGQWVDAPINYKRQFTMDDLLRRYGCRV